MRCPECACCDTSVYRTMKITKIKIRRYRKCRHCHNSFSSTETRTIQETPERFVVKDDDNEDLVIID